MQLKLHLSATGLGDSVCGLYAACGAASAGHDVTFHTRHSDWFDRIAHPRLTLAPHADDGVDMNADYEGHVRAGRARKNYYCDSISNALNVPAFDPSPPQFVDKTHREANEIFSGKTDVVLLSPFSAWRVREWPSVYYARLAELLHQRKLDVVALVTADESSRAQDEFGFLPNWMSWYHEHEVAWISEAILAARCVVGNDSGVAHYAALLGAKTVAIHAQLSPQTLWSHTDVQSATPTTKCRFCRWQGTRGYSESCSRACSALHSISPEQVLSEIFNDVK